MSETAKQFWNWFKANNEVYLSFDEQEDITRQEEALDELIERLQDYCEALWFEIVGPDDNGVTELIITAEGDTEFFATAEELVSYAPIIEGWKIIALIPPMYEAEHFNINYEGIELDTEDLWFLPLEDPEEQDSIGLHVCMENHEDVKDDENLIPALAKMVQTLLGERAFSEDVDYMETGPIPTGDEAKEMISIVELREFVEWHKSEYPRKG